MTKEQIFENHVKQFFAKNMTCGVEDIPVSVFFDMMEAYANERLKNNNRADDVVSKPSEAFLISDDVKSIETVGWSLNEEQIAKATETGTLKGVACNYCKGKCSTITRCPNCGGLEPMKE